MKHPSVEEQCQFKDDADEIRKSIIQKRESSAEINSSNTQRFIDDALASMFLYFVIAGLLLLFKLVEPNKISTVSIVSGFIITIVILFIFGVTIIKLRQKQEVGETKEKLIMPILLLSFIPYVFGLYLILVVGIYNLFTVFSFVYLPQAIIFAYLGYLVMRSVKITQELGLRISENKRR